MTDIGGVFAGDISEGCNGGSGKVVDMPAGTCEFGLRGFDGTVAYFVKIFCSSSSLSEDCQHGEFRVMCHGSHTYFL